MVVVYWANHRSSLAEINSAVFSSFIFNAFATRAAIVWARNTAFRRIDWGISPLLFLRLLVRCPLRRTLGPFSLPAHTEMRAHAPLYCAPLEKLVNGGDNPARYTHLWIFSRHIIFNPPLLFSATIPSACGARPALQTRHAPFSRGPLCLWAHNARIFRL